MMVRVHSESELKRKEKKKKKAPTHKEIRRTWWLARKSNADLLLIFPMRHTDFFDFKSEILESESRDKIKYLPTMSVRSDNSNAKRNPLCKRLG